MAPLAPRGGFSASMRGELAHLHGECEPWCLLAIYPPRWAEKARVTRAVSPVPRPRHGGQDQEKRPGSRCRRRHRKVSCAIDPGTYSRSNGLSNARVRLPRDWNISDWALRPNPLRVRASQRALLESLGARLASDASDASNASSWSCWR